LNDLARLVLFRAYLVRVTDLQPV